MNESSNHVDCLKQVCYYFCVIGYYYMIRIGIFTWWVMTRVKQIQLEYTTQLAIWTDFKTLAILANYVNGFKEKTGPHTLTEDHTTSLPEENVKERRKNVANCRNIYNNQHNKTLADTHLSVLDETVHTFSAIQWSFDFESVAKRKSNLQKCCHRHVFPMSGDFGCFQESINAFI